MTGKYESKLPRLAEYAARHPTLYRARVVALAAMAYGVILGMLLFLIAIEGLLMWGVFSGEVALLKLAIPVLLLIGILVSALQIEINPPKGIELTRAAAPALWAEIDRVRKAVRAPAPYRVLVDGDLNASVVQIPRMGVMGFYRTYLTIGLPMAMALTPDEFRAVLAHEYGHLSGRHGRLGAWIYRVQSTWAGLLGELEHEGHWSAALVRAFMKWFVPYFDAYTAVLRRAHEFEADRESAGVAGAATAATALCRVEAAGQYLSTVFWPAVFARVPEGPVAPAGVYRAMLGELPAAVQHPGAEGWIRTMAGEKTRPWDTHPATAERLAALGAKPALPAAPARPSAADAYLGAAETGRLADRLSRRWVDDTQFSWGKKHREFAPKLQRLSELEAAAAAQPLSNSDSLMRIMLTVQVRGDTVAMPLMRGFVDAGGSNATVHFLLGRSLLEQGDDSGIAQIERAMEMDSELIPPGCELVIAFLESRGRGHDVARYRQRAADYNRLLERSAEERDRLSSGDRFLPHGLNEAHTRHLIGQLTRVSGLKRALLVRKEVELFPDHPCFVLAIEPIGKSTPTIDPYVGVARYAAAIVNAGTPGSLTVIRLLPDALGTALARVPGAELYPGAPVHAAAT